MNSGEYLLSLFHEAVKHNTEIVSQDNTIVFDLGNGKTIREPMTRTTPFVFKAGPATLETLFWAYSSRTVRWAQYFNNVVARQVTALPLREFQTFVQFLDKGDLLSLLPPGSVLPDLQQQQLQQPSTVSDDVVHPESSVDDLPHPQYDFDIPHTPPGPPPSYAYRKPSSSTPKSTRQASRPDKEQELRAKRARPARENTLFDEGILGRPARPLSPEIERATQRQRSLHTTSSILQCEKDFSELGEIVSHTIDLIRRAPSAEPGPHSSASRNSSSSSKPASTHSSSSFSHSGSQPSSSSSANRHGVSSSASPGMPIIIVPCTNTSLFTLANVARFLEKGEYVDLVPGKAVISAKDGIVISRPSTKDTVEGSPPQYRVVDNPLVLSAEDWPRVAAVFVLGPEWQFQKWPTGFNRPIDLFDRACGFHFYWNTDKPNPNVGKWKVFTLPIPKEIKNRHQASQAFLDFWQRIERFISIQRSKGASF